MTRVVVRKRPEFAAQPWRITCPECTGGRRPYWHAASITAVKAIDVATRHANGHRSHP